MLFTDKIDATPPHQLVFSAGTFSPLTQPKLTRTIRHLLMQAGMCPKNYISHNFRIGAATTAAAAGIPSLLIKIFGRWSTDAYLTYVHCPNNVIALVPAALSSAIVEHQPTWNPDS